MSALFSVDLKAENRGYQFQPLESMEPTTGIEPVNLILTKDVLYQLSYVGPTLERETGLEPATLSLEG